MADRNTIFLLVTVLVLVTVLLIFAMKYVSTARQARLRIASEDDYRNLADQSAKAQRENAEVLHSLKESVADIDARLARVEKVLKEVE